MDENISKADRQFNGVAFLATYYICPVVRKDNGATQKSLHRSLYFSNSVLHMRPSLAFELIFFKA